MNYFSVFIKVLKFKESLNLQALLANTRSKQLLNILLFWENVIIEHMRGILNHESFVYFFGEVRTEKCLQPKTTASEAVDVVKGLEI